MTTLTDSSVVSATENHISADVGGEHVLLHAETGTYHGLAGVASTIWETIQEPTAVVDIHERLCAEYDVDSDECRRDLLAFLDELASAQLAVVE